MGAGCIVHCNKVRKPVKGKYMVVICMNSIMYIMYYVHYVHYVFLTNFIHFKIMFLKVLSHFIMKIKNFMKYFKEGVLKYFHEIFKYFKVKYFIVHPYSRVTDHDVSSVRRG